MIPKGKVGFAFCTYVAPGTRVLATHDVGKRRLALFPTWRVRGYAAAFRLGMIIEIVLMGTIDEVETYKEELIELGVDPAKISFLITSNTTIGNANDLHRELERRGLTLDDWLFLTSNYHLERAIETARIKHSIVPRHAYGAETCLKYEAYEQGGTSAMEDLVQEMEDNIDPEEFLARVLWEKNGCEVLRLDSGAYVPDK